MPHDSFTNAPDVTWGQIGAAVRHAHQLRAQSVTGYFKKALDRRHRALDKVSR